MSTKFNFKSAVCTSVDQSRRLLELGLKKETADMLIMSYSTEQDIIALSWSESGGWTKDNSIPAWSLHRLLSLLPECVYHKNKACFLYLHLGVFCEWRSTIWDWEANDKAVEIFDKPDLWENLIDCIEWLIKEGYFNKEYLCQK